MRGSAETGNDGVAATQDEIDLMMAFLGAESDGNSTIVEPDELVFVAHDLILVQQQGFAVESVTNAADALLYITRAPVDVLLTDINLPGGMDGMTLARRARQLRPDVVVIHASARAVLKQEARVPGSLVCRSPMSRLCSGVDRRRLWHANHDAGLIGPIAVSHCAPGIPRANECGIGRR